MADMAHTTIDTWIEHNGRGRPVPIGTIVQVRRFNGDVDTFPAGFGAVVDGAGNVIRDGKARWSGWDYSDGGPRSAKFREYRLVHAAVPASSIEEFA